VAKKALEAVLPSSARGSKIARSATMRVKSGTSTAAQFPTMPPSIAFSTVPANAVPSPLNRAESPPLLPLNIIAPSPVTVAAMSNWVLWIVLLSPLKYTLPETISSLPSSTWRTAAW
jgi:hypothetical protein